jgi:DNA-3-methyladenine glycosylase
MRERLPLPWFQRSPAVVARELVGCVLWHRGRGGRIVETEAYLGPEDRASHARFGPTARSAVMFGRPGVTYVYLCYGIHHMFNIVAHEAGAVGAVLVRAVDVIDADDPATGRGPGKVTRALGLGPRHHALPLDGDVLFVAPGPRPRVVVTPRIGVDYAGVWARRRLRFAAAGHPAVSRRR